MDGFLQAWNYSSHLPLIPLPLWRLHGQSACFLCAPCFPLNQNSYGAISFLSTFTSPCPPPSPALFIFPRFLRLTVYGTVANGWWVYRLSFSQSVSGYVCVYGGYGVEWSGMDWLCALSIYSRFQKAACYGALYRSVCVCVCLCVYCI